MTTEAAQFFGWFWQTFWQFFNSWYIPGTNVTPAGFMLFSVFTYLVLKFLNVFIGFGSISSSDINSTQRKLGGK